MKNFGFAIAVALGALGCGDAAAQTSNPNPDEESFKAGPFACMSLSAFQDYTAGSKDLRVNNFSVIERSSIMNQELTVLEVAYSVANRSSRDINVDGQFYLLEGRAAEATVVMTASPNSYIAFAGKTDTAKGGTFVPKGTLERASSICVRVVGDF